MTKNTRKKEILEMMRLMNKYPYSVQKYIEYQDSQYRAKLEIELCNSSEQNETSYVSTTQGLKARSVSGEHAGEDADVGQDAPERYPTERSTQKDQSREHGADARGNGEAKVQVLPVSSPVQNPKKKCTCPKPIKSIYHGVIVCGRCGGAL